MKDRIVLVTGATGGIGEVTARELARMGATVIGVGRNPDKCAQMSTSLRQTTGNPGVEFLVADLSVQAQVLQLADSIQERYPRLDVLVNNAGGFFFRREVSADGIEMTFALDHLSYFLLTNLLVRLLESSPAARVVNVSSDAHRGGEMAFTDLEFQRGYNGWKAYAQSKLANVLFTYELARRLDEKGVTVNALHPGFVATRFGYNNGWLVRAGIWLSQRFAGRTPEQGAETSIFLASSPEVRGITGKYFVDKRAIPSSPASYDVEAARQLWQVSEALTRINPA